MYYVAIACRFAIAGVLLMAAIGKLSGRARFQSFALSLSDARLIPAGIARPVAAGVVTSELAVASLLMSRPTAGAGLILGAALLGVFTGALVRLRRQGAACGCFGATTRDVGVHHIARNVGLLLLCGIGYLAFRGSSAAIDEDGGILVAVLASAVAVFSILLLEEIAGLATRRPSRRGMPGIWT